MILLIIFLSEISLTIELKFTINLYWYETKRVSYHNLKPELSLNVLSDEEMNSLWTPFVIYTNTDNNDATKVNHKFREMKTTMAVMREGNFTKSSIETVDEIEIFKVVNIFLHFFIMIHHIIFREQRIRSLSTKHTARSSSVCTRYNSILLILR